MKTEHMYYPDLPCWCGGQPAFGIPHAYGPTALEEVTSVNDPEAAQVAADQDEQAEASQDDQDDDEEQAHEANPF